MNEFLFTKKTFGYFDGARRHATDRAWFDDNRAVYEQHVQVPLTHLVMELKRELSPLLPGIDFTPRKLAKPLLRVAKGTDGPVVRDKVTAFFAETATSMFESNPGIYISFGAASEDNVYGVGLYDVSSRQMKRLRPAFLSDHAAADACIKSRLVTEHWAGLSGARFQRFPKDFEETAPGAEYLWHKQFLLSKTFTRATATKPTFVEAALEDFATAIEFLQWLRATVGVYRRQVE